VTVRTSVYDEKVEERGSFNCDIIVEDAAVKW